MQLIDVLDSRFLVEARGQSLILRGVMGSCNRRNANGRTYPCNLLERAVRNLQPRIKDRTSMIWLNHQNTLSADPEKAAAVLTKLELRNGLLLGQGLILDSNAGRTLVSLHRNGSKVQFSTRGTGSVNDNGTVQSDFKLDGVDAICAGSDASVKETYMELCESIQEDQRHPFEREILSYWEVIRNA